jgi:4-carboxymuconolactone decarboxylase
VEARGAFTARSQPVATLAALIARHQDAEMADHLNLALDHGVTPAEISEAITHLGFYSGLGNAMSAVAAAKSVFEQRGISKKQLPAARPSLLPLDQTAEADRAQRVGAQLGEAFPGLVQYTRRAVPRPVAAPRSRAA